MFTDRFIKVPCKIYDTKEEELTGNSKGESAFIKILPLEISHYYKSNDNEEPEIPCVQVCLKSGIYIMVFLELHEFEKLLNDHFVVNA